MNELKTSARLRMMAKGAFTRGDVISADRLSRVAIEHDSLVDQLAAAMAEIAECRTMIESIVNDAKGYESRGGNLPLWAKDADDLLAKYKGE